jgi:thiosulfate reductase cytochrome b subunit
MHCIGTWVKEGRWACVDSSLLKHKLATLVNTHFAFKFIMFEQCLSYRIAIVMCYNHRRKGLIGFLLQQLGQL